MIKATASKTIKKGNFHVSMSNSSVGQ